MSTPNPTGSYTSEEQRKFNEFLLELLDVGCTKGFRNFSTHLRGREEMTVKIVNEPSVPVVLTSQVASPGFSLNQSILRENLPRSRQSMLLSGRWQRRLSGYGFLNVGLPPASPSEHETDQDSGSTLFLLACYARYHRPYAWVRTNHHRLIRLNAQDATEKDHPLKLRSTSQWNLPGRVRVWDIMAELVTISCQPMPPNPFQVDFDYFDTLEPHERALASGAMTRILLQILTTGTRRYNTKVKDDLLLISQRHFASMVYVMANPKEEKSRDAASKVQNNTVSFLS